ncbi:unnamed protein product [Clonostachys byssicola]|uniref:Uncharacterized protein n=1 Tax=Clonostachys byssicola TaxID=160290 RepID=A0A9N9TZE6_9HYPO|nr:unnamed protein product [Clonostachys byssicola]
MAKYEAQHANPSGPGDTRPTAVQIVQDEELIGKLTDKVAFVTGANQGISLEIARALYVTRATVFLRVRDLNKGQEAIAKILSTSDHKFPNTLQAVELSLDSLESVRKATETFLTKSKQLNLLILNTGVMATPLSKTKDGFETQFGIIHLGHFLLANLLIPTLIQSSTPQFILRDSYDPWVSYIQSKTANIYFANELERRYGTKGVHRISMNPGNSTTILDQYLDQQTIEDAKKNTELMSYFKSPEQGAATAIYVAIGREWEGRGAIYLAECSQQGPTKSQNPLDTQDQGYASWAFNEPDAVKLWEISSELVGLERIHNSSD